MIALGVSPGLAACAYSVLSFPGPELRARPVDTDVLHGTGHSETALAWQISRSTRVHSLVMGVVLERQPPGIVAFGPPLDPKEPVKHADAVVAVLSDLGRLFGARLVHFTDEEEMREELTSALGVRVGERGVRKAVSDLLIGQLPSSNRRVVIATAVALAGVWRVRGQQLR